MPWRSCVRDRRSSASQCRVLAPHRSSHSTSRATTSATRTPSGRIDEQPFEPYQDSQWRLRPGLSDPNAVSFESVNRPGYFLRHQGFEAKLMQNDGTSGFAADATFTRVAGRADANFCVVF
ncbi:MULTISPECIES: AbfB domain-containing protein [unclassified Saccharothrix]|uniref:AbfB domain-containing protein n=1 Tax=unclassified Saccharothrix TaxID=2593673 RepID=UPI00307D2A1B